MGSFTGKLGDFAKYDLKERTRKYAEEQEVNFLSDREALSIPRVRWLREENVRLPFREVLDVGCHDGFTTRWLAESSDLEELIGLEPCKPACKMAEEAVAHLSGCMHYVPVGWESYVDPEPFDVVVCYELLEHFTADEGRDLLKFLKHSCTPDGRIYLSTPNRNGAFGSTNDDPCHIQLYDNYDLAELLAEIFPGEQRTWYQFHDDCPVLMVKIERGAFEGSNCDSDPVEAGGAVSDSGDGDGDVLRDSGARRFDVSERQGAEVQPAHASGDGPAAGEAQPGEVK